MAKRPVMHLISHVAGLATRIHSRYSELNRHLFISIYMASRIQRGYRCVTARREVARRRGTLHVPDLPVSEEIPLATAVAVNESVNGNRRNVVEN